LKNSVVASGIKPLHRTAAPAGWHHPDRMNHVRGA
jgi:hypothetical protein